MRDREPLPNQDAHKIIRHGDIESPAREVFNTRELNRLSEVQRNSPEMREPKPEPVVKFSRVREALVNLVRPIGAPRISLRRA